MRPALEGQVVDPVHLGGGERNGWRIEPDVGIAVSLHQRTRVAGVRLQMQDARGVRIEHRVGGDLFEGWQADHAVLAIRIGHAAQETHNSLALAVRLARRPARRPSPPELARRDRRVD
jgi:hypothetical protein